MFLLRHIKVSVMYGMVPYHTHHRTVCVVFLRADDKHVTYYEKPSLQCGKEGSYPFKIGTFQKMLRCHRYSETR